ncbi:jg139, partial [Pararge aegeria aegeria]
VRTRSLLVRAGSCSSGVALQAGERQPRVAAVARAGAAAQAGEGARRLHASVEVLHDHGVPGGARRAQPRRQVCQPRLEFKVTPRPERTTHTRRLGARCNFEMNLQFGWIWNDKKWSSVTFYAITCARVEERQVRHEPHA